MKRLKKNIVPVSVALFPVFLVLLVFRVLFLTDVDISADQHEERHVFGATFMTMNNPYYQEMDTQMRAKIEMEGDVLLTRDGAMNQGRQNEEILELIEAGAEVIFVSCVDWETADEGIFVAAKAGVPVVIVDTPIKNDDDVTCSIVSDNYTAGVLCAEHLLSVRDSANIILLEHLSAGSGKARIRGFVDTISGHDGFRIVGSGESDGQIESSMPVMEKLLPQAPEADAVMALNDPSALGALAAIEGANLSERFLVYGVDGSPDAKALVRDGLMTATCAQFPYRIASEAVAVAYGILAGEETQKDIVIPVELVTRDNVGQFGTAGWQ